MRTEFLIYKNKGNEKLHARFIINKVDSDGMMNKPAALCMESKKIKLFT